MRKAILIGVMLTIIVSVFFYFHSRPVEKGIESTVSRVIDGDTIEMANGDLVRLIGIDAPEKNQPYNEEIIEELKVLEGNVVRMEKDVTNKDRYGRYLRYVFFEDKLVNIELLQNGLAYAYIVSPDRKYEKEILEAEGLAMRSGIGVWSKSDQSECVSLVDFHYNAKGEDDKNLADEFFVLENICDRPVKMNGWTVRDKFKSFGIKDSEISSGKSLKIVSGSGRDTGDTIFLSSDRPIWDNSGDILYLRDGRGGMILVERYGKS